MKKFLSLLLALLLLYGFGISASAKTPRDLLAQTMKDLGKNYTMQVKSGDYAQILYNGEAHAFVRADGVRDIHIDEQAYRVYPERGAYHRLSSSASFDYLPLLMPKAIPKGAVTSEKLYGSVGVSFEGCRYWYKNDALWSIDGDTSPEILVEKFSKKADQDVFSLDGLRKVPELAKWLWEPQQILDLVSDLDTPLGVITFALLGALLIALSPLVYVLIVVLRLLFYFDIYKA